MNVLLDFVKTIFEFFKSIPKELSRWILRKELDEMDSQLEARAAACREWEDKYKELLSNYQKLYDKVASSVRCILPNGVVAKIISYLPDPNAVGNKSELRIDREFVLSGDYTKIYGDDGRWWFEVKFLRLVKVSDEKILLEVSLRNNKRYFKLEIPATVEFFNGQVRTWVWNIYESGMVVITDNIYSFINKADDVWCKVQRDLGLV